MPDGYTVGVTPRLDLSLDRGSEVPLATQLAWKLRTLVATGALAPGERLPGVRELAEQAAVNINTVRGVYGRLEEDGLLTSHHGRGTFVAQNAAVRRSLAEIARAAASDARAAGLDPREIAAALFVDGDLSDRRPAPGPAARSDRAQRRGLRAEIARLEGELAYLEGLAGAESRPGRRPDAAHLPDTAELETIRDDLLDRLRTMRDEREQARRDVEAARRAPEPIPARVTGEPRVWRHGGVWTGALKPGGVVYES